MAEVFTHQSNDLKFDYEEDINDLCGWFYRKNSPLGNITIDGPSSSVPSAFDSEVKKMIDDINTNIKDIKDKVDEGIKCDCGSGEIMIEDLVDEEYHNN